MTDSIKTTQDKKIKAINKKIELLLNQQNNQLFKLMKMRNAIRPDFHLSKIQKELHTKYSEIQKITSI